MATPNILWKSEGRDHTGFRVPKQVILFNSLCIKFEYWQADLLHCIVSANMSSNKFAKSLNLLVAFQKQGPFFCKDIIYKRVTGAGDLG